MKISYSWQRNEPDSIGGESITLKIVYSSFDRKEIDELQERMPKGVLIGDTEPPKNEESDRYPT